MLNPDTVVYYEAEMVFLLHMNKTLYNQLAKGCIQSLEWTSGLGLLDSGFSCFWKYTLTLYIAM